MKEELKKLKEIATEYAKASNDFKKQRNFFDMKVEEKNNELNICEIFKSEEEQYDSYEAATLLIFLFPQIRDIVSQIRLEHPKYGERRIKELTAAELLSIMETEEYLPSFKDKVDAIVDNYFLYENCGFFKVFEKQNELNKLEESAKTSTTEVVNETKAATKSVINKGSKKLIKILEEIENKTKTK